MYTDWALDCRLCHCDYKSNTQQVVCEQLNAHRLQLQDTHLKSLPLRFQFPLKSFPVRNQTEHPENTDLCMIYCLADLIQFFHQLTERISVDSITDVSQAGGYTVVEVCRLLSKYGCTTETGYQNLRTATASSFDNDDSKRSKIPYFTLKEEFGLIHTVEAVKLALLYAGPCLLILPCHRKHGKFWLPAAAQAVALADTTSTESAAPSSTTATTTASAAASAASHSVLIWGYQPSGFILRNSWSVVWANRGYGVISFQDFLQYKLECWYFLSARGLLNAALAS